MSVIEAPPGAPEAKDMDEFSISRIEHRFDDITLDDYHIRDSLEQDNMEEPTL